MAFYEHVVIARQDISPQQAEALNEELKALIESQGGHIAKIEYWGLRNLTYRIKKNRKGHYSLLAIDAPSPAVKEMERQLSINEDVLRFLTVRVEELDLELSPVLARRDRERGEREGRERRDFEDVPALGARE
ncbi:MAG TPA: 30S ribosomal protein S6 [Caulobacteraceae bacterium]|nr:30S ribosomal protein S6 [Caulobacteraceae bacterium]